jgi:hypothetical protein
MLLNLTVLVPWVVPNPVPVIVTRLPDKADAGDMLVILRVEASPMGALFFPGLEKGRIAWALPTPM